MKIGLTGTHGTGKTTLVQELRKTFYDYNVYESPARHLTALPLFRTNKDADDISQTVITGACAAHLMMNENTLADRTLFDYFAYSDYSVNVKDQEKIERTFKEAVEKYDLVCYVPIEFEMAEDGVRLKDQEYRQAIQDRILFYLKKYEINTLLLPGPSMSALNKSMTP